MKSLPLAKTALLALLSLAMLPGCGGGEGNFPTAPVTGKVSFDGQAVKGGTVMLIPIPKKPGDTAGKSATGKVGDDGTFTMGTYAEDDGAVIGKHKVTYTPPSSDASQAPAEGQHVQEKPSLYAGLKPKQGEVEIEDKPNELNIDLAK